MYKPKNKKVFNKLKLMLAFLSFSAICFCQKPDDSQNQPGAGTEQINAIPNAYSESTIINYIRSYDVTKPLSLETDVASQQRTLSEVKQTTQYFDGLGRLLQTVAMQMGQGKDIVSPVLYDSYGREVYKYLPYVSNTGEGNFKMDPFQEQSDFMQNYSPASGESYYYGKTDYEASPLNRVNTTYAPGNSWVGSNKGTSIVYSANTNDDKVHIWNISFTPGSIPVAGGTYDSGELFETITTDENGARVIEYKDKEGHIILKKVEADATHSGPYNNWLCTYYVYDDFGNLRFVLPPSAVNYLTSKNWVLDGATWDASSVAKGLCFSYEYDDRQRMIIKRVPGAGEVWMVYDKRDRLIMMQDENLRANAQNKWIVTVYDALNRPVQTGIFTDNNLSHDRTWQQQQATNSASLDYPNTTNNFELYTETHYDNYQWISDENVPLRSTLIPTNINNTQYFLPADNSTFPYAQAIKANYQNRNMVTGTATLVLGSNPVVYEYSVNFYDDRGRVLQTQSTNYSNLNSVTKDTLTTQYSFSGQVLRTLVAHKKGGLNTQNYRVCTKNNYDAAGRLISVSKIIGNQFKTSPEAIIAQNVYDKLGKLLEKDLGQQVDATNTSSYSYLPDPVDVVKYSYNIRGWLRGINKDYARGGGSGTPWFGMELCYDYGFTNNQLNGNIAGERWRSKGDGEQRAYGFNYDMANRLTSADYNQLSGSAWDKTKTDFTTNNLTYDANGNILSMNQMGMQLNNIVQLDQLDYGYFAQSNQLRFVTDNSPGWSSTLGDFKETGNNSSTDYAYDANGNLTQDNNKSISNITYNNLNLPQQITIPGKGVISYTYDAAGNKLLKVTDEPASATNGNTHITTTTSYFGHFVYVKTEVTPSGGSLKTTGPLLQFISTEEGRARPATPGNADTFYYDYFEKDHLGNVRVVLTDQLKQDVYPVADVESSNTAALTTEKQYYDIQDANIVDESNITAFDGTASDEYENNNGNPPYNNNPSANTNANSTKLYKLNGAAGSKTGLGITLKVMSGDMVNIFGKSFYHLNSGQNPDNSYLITSSLLDLLNVFAGSTAVTATHTGITGSTLNGNSSITSPLSSWLNNSSHTPPGNTPKAYINWVFLDEQFNPVTSGGMSGADRVSDANNTLKTHSETVNITRNGYLYVYCSNESDVDVFFDNLQVIQTHGPLVEETHYYPFGLTMSGILSSALNFGSPENKKKFQGQEFAHKEFSDGSGLEMYEFKWRMDDPEIGRFWQVDPLANKYVYNSPYAFSENKVTSHIELEGLEAVVPNWLLDAYIYLKGTSNQAKDATYRLSTGTSGQSESQHVPTPLKQGVKNLATLNDVGKAITPYVQILQTVNTIASLTPVGEAGVATGIAINTFKVVGQSSGEVALNAEGKAIVGAICKDAGIAKSFKDGAYNMVELQQDITVYRTFGEKSGEAGSFFGFTKPTSSANAESMYNLINYGNDASFVTPVTMKKGTQIAIGNVEGGTGAQIYIPVEAQGNKVIYWSKESVALPER